MFGSGRRLIIFDFDQTILNRNADPEFVKLLSEESRNDWQKYMNEAFREAQQQLKMGQKELADFAATLALTDGLQSLLRTVVRRRNEPTSNADAVDVIILSDCNDEPPPESFSQLPQLAHSLRTGIFTNPCSFDASGLMQIRPFQLQTKCSRCPRNMCKGSFVEDLLGLSNYDRIIYVGDGYNDFCAGRALRGRDLLLARRGFSLERQLARNEPAVVCQWRLWADGDDLDEIIYGPAAV